MKREAKKKKTKIKPYGTYKCDLSTITSDKMVMNKAKCYGSSSADKMRVLTEKRK